MMTVGVIGLGRMGAVIAERLLGAGMSVTVWNRTQKSVQDLVAAGAASAESPRDLALQSDIVLVMVSEDRAVKEVISGENGVLASGKSGLLVCVMSTVTPQTIIELAGVAADKGIAIVDAPVSGTVEPAQQGALVFFVGGEAADVERLQPVLQHLARRVVHMGAPGTAAAMKLALNLPLSVYWQSLGEALALGAAYGLEKDRMLELIADSGAALAALPAKFDVILGENRKPAEFDISGCRNNLLAILEAASGVGVSAPTASSALAAYAGAVGTGWGTDDVARISLYPMHTASLRSA